jgi:hypothetical protein
VSSIRCRDHAVRAVCGRRTWTGGDEMRECLRLFDAQISVKSGSRGLFVLQETHVGIMRAHAIAQQPRL